MKIISAHAATRSMPYRLKIFLDTNCSYVVLQFYRCIVVKMVISLRRTIGFHQLSVQKEIPKKPFWKIHERHKIYLIRLRSASISINKEPLNHIFQKVRVLTVETSQHWAGSSADCNYICSTISSFYTKSLGSRIFVMQSSTSAWNIFNSLPLHARAIMRNKICGPTGIFSSVSRDSGQALRREKWQKS